MTDKKVVVKKVYGSSWITTLILGLIVGIIGALICPSNPIMGFLAGFALTAMTTIIMLASFIPFAGVPLYWMWTWALYHWVLGVAFGVGTANYGNMITLMWFPIIVCAIFGVILCAVTSIIALVFIGAIIGAIVG
jgi:hypothetical protein